MYSLIRGIWYCNAIYKQLTRLFYLTGYLYTKIIVYIINDASILCIYIIYDFYDINDLVYSLLFA